jgi:hypothetical protein
LATIGSRIIAVVGASSAWPAALARKSAPARGIDHFSKRHRRGVSALSLILLILLILGKRSLKAALQDAWPAG